MTYYYCTFGENILHEHKFLLIEQKREIRQLTRKIIWNSYYMNSYESDYLFVPRQIYHKWIHFQVKCPLDRITISKHPVLSEEECAPSSPQTSVHDHRLLFFFSSPVCTYVIEYVSSQLSRSFTTNSPISQPSTLFTLAVPPGSIRSMEIQIEFELFAGIF